MTQVASTSTLNPQLVSVAFFTRVTRGSNFTNLMTDPAPSKLDDGKADPTRQTAPGAPIVRITDLQAKKGDNVSMDVFNPPRKKPTMGDKKIAGRGESLTFNSFKTKINQGRHMLDAGGAMTQQRTEIHLVNLCSSLLRPYYNQLSDEILTTVLAGARGSDVNDWILPLDTDEEFADIMVNAIKPPTYDRHFYANDATALSGLDSTDKLTLDDVDRLRLLMAESKNPLQPLRYTKDTLSDDNPFYILKVTRRQFYDLNKSAGAQTMAQLRAQAITRGTQFDHPIFKGESYLYNNILICPMNKPITFAANSVVQVSQNVAAATPTGVTCAVKTDRAILLGAQAACDVMGNAGGGFFSLNTEDTDHKNAKEVSCKWMNGKDKIRFENNAGFMSDFGVAVLDTATS